MKVLVPILIGLLLTAGVCYAVTPEEAAQLAQNLESQAAGQGDASIQQLKTQYPSQFAAADRNYSNAVNAAAINKDAALARAATTQTAAINNAAAAQQRTVAQAQTTYNNSVTTATNTLSTSVARAGTTKTNSINTALSQYNTQVAAINANTRLTAAQKAQRIAAAQTTYNNRVTSANNTYNTAVQRAQTTYNTSLTNAAARRGQTIANAQTTYNTAVARANTTYNNAVSAANNNYNQRLATAMTNYLSALARMSPRGVNLATLYTAAQNQKNSLVAQARTVGTGLLTAAQQGGIAGRAISTIYYNKDTGEITALYKTQW